MLKSTWHVRHVSRSVCDNRNLRGVLAYELTRAPRQITWRKRSWQKCESAPEFNVKCPNCTRNITWTHVTWEKFVPDLRSSDTHHSLDGLKWNRVSDIHDFYYLMTVCQIHKKIWWNCNEEWGDDLAYIFPVWRMTILRWSNYSVYKFCNGNRFSFISWLITMNLRTSTNMSARMSFNLAET
jgi:hypothetical protein